MTNAVAQFGIDETVIIDQSVESEGGSFESILKAEGNDGPAVCRLVGYVQYGVHTGKGKNPKTGKMHMLTFEVNTPKHRKEIEVDVEGVKVKKTITECISVRFRDGDNPKSAMMNFFKRMDYGRGNKNFYQMLGEAFLVTLTHTKGDDGKVKYVNIHDGMAGTYDIGAPMKTLMDDFGAVTGTKQLDVPAPTKDLQCFLWDQPNQAMWDSIQVGDKEQDDEKNWIKNLCFTAENFVGSPLDVMLGGVAAADLPAHVEGADPAKQATATADDLDDLGGL